jgi:hypothetical protein
MPARVAIAHRISPPINVVALSLGGPAGDVAHLAAVPPRLLSLIVIPLLSKVVDPRLLVMPEINKAAGMKLKQLV